MKRSSPSEFSPAEFLAALSATRWAVLVDGQNMPQSLADQIMESVEAVGKATVARVYCDPCRQTSWDEDPRFSTVYLGHENLKNAADIRLAIDAMELAFEGAVDGIVIVSKDGDFTPLAEKLCQKGFDVIGIGFNQVSVALRHACTVYIDLSLDDVGPESVSPRNEIRTAPEPPSKILPLVKKAVRKSEEKLEWYGSQQLATLIRAEDASFDAAAYGCSDLREVLEKTGQFEVRDQVNGGWRTRFKS